jgi:hypothetical protein
VLARCNGCHDAVKQLPMVVICGAITVSISIRVLNDKRPGSMLSCSACMYVCSFHITSSIKVSASDKSNSMDAEL